MRLHGSRRRVAPLLGLLAAFVLPPGAARAQSMDCTALREEIDASGRPDDAGRFDVALRQQREEIDRTRAYADQTGCGDGVFDDPNSSQCRALARRIDTLELALRHLQDRAARGDPADDERRRTLQKRFDDACRFERASTDPSVVTMPVDPGPSPDPDAPAPASPARSAVVLCVRHCDGAYYPLAADIASDRLGDMDRICQAQCPAAESSAYAGHDADDVAGALASDGTRYTDLAAAFQFRKGTSQACACRAPKQSWAETLAGAEAMLETHKGDVTVTPALAAAMAQPAPAPTAGRQGPAKPAATAKRAPRKAVPSPIVVPAPAPSPDPALDLTPEFRRSGPTL